MPDESAVLFFAGEGLKLCMHARCWIDSLSGIACRGTRSHALVTQFVNVSLEADQCLPDASCLQTELQACDQVTHSRQHSGNHWHHFGRHAQARIRGFGRMKSERTVARLILLLMMMMMMLRADLDELILHCAGALGNSGGPTVPLHPKGSCSVWPLAAQPGGPHALGHFDPRGCILTWQLDFTR